jgi:hypothetical protein
MSGFWKMTDNNPIDGLTGLTELNEQLSQEDEQKLKKFNKEFLK